MTDTNTDIAKNLNSMRSSLLFDEMVGFAQLGDYGLFIPSAARFSQNFLDWRPHEKVNPREFMLRKKKNTLFQDWKPTSDPKRLHSDCRVYLKHIFDTLDQNNLSMALMDVGGYLGIYGMLSSLIAKDFGIDMPVECYEPGPTNQFIQANAVVNGVSDNYNLNEVAVSDFRGPMLYNYAPDQTISGGLNNMNFELSRISYSVDLEAEVEKKFAGRDVIIAKIDVEGFEPEVFSGMGKHRSKFKVLICEIQPWASKKIVEGLPFTQFLDKHYFVIDLANSIWPHFYKGIEESGVAAYVEEVGAKKIPVSDAILIRKDFSLGRRLYNELSALSAFDRTGLKGF